MDWPGDALLDAGRFISARFEDISAYMQHHGLHRSDTSNLPHAPKHLQDTIKKLEHDFHALQFRSRVQAIDLSAIIDL